MESINKNCDFLFKAIAEAGKQTKPHVSDKGAFEADPLQVLNSAEFRKQLKAVESVRIAKMKNTGLN